MQIRPQVRGPAARPGPVRSRCRRRTSTPGLRAAPAPQSGSWRRLSSPAAPLEEPPAGIRKGTPAIRGHGSRVILPPIVPGAVPSACGSQREPRPPQDASVAACAYRPRPNGQRPSLRRASRPRHFVAHKHAKSPCRARQSTPAYPLARSASKCRATERRPGSWSLKTSGATTKSALRNRPPTDSNS